MSAFGPLRNRILARDLCTFMTQGPSCKALFTQNTCIFIRMSVLCPVYKPISVSMIWQEDASCYKRGEQFCSFALSRWGPEFTPKCISGALLVDLAGLFPSNNIAPRSSKKHNFNFWAKTGETNPIQFSLFSRPWKSVCNFFDFSITFQKNASCLGAEHIFERHVHELSCPPPVFTPTWRASNWLRGTPLSLTKY